jgi:hypothetical protein
LLAEQNVKDLIHGANLSQTMKLLLCLAVGDGPKQVAEVREIAARVGLPAAKSWNVSQFFAGSKGKAINTPSGWELSITGRAAVEALAGPLLASPPAKAAVSLRAQLASIPSNDTRAFVEQAISCFEHKLYRAAVVLSWVGAVSLLYDHVVANELSAFNAEATKRNSKWKPAKNPDGLARMEEHEFLQIIEALSVIGKNVKHELEGCLKLRNGCGHPNSLQIAEHRVSSHIEILTLNVFAKF